MVPHRVEIKLCLLGPLIRGYPSMQVESSLTLNLFYYQGFFFFSILLILKARRWKIIECRFLAFQLDLLFLITTATKIWHQTHTTEGKNRVTRLSDLCPSMPGIQNMSKVFHVGKTENYCWRWPSLFSSQMHIFHLTFSLLYGSTRDKLLLNKIFFWCFWSLLIFGEIQKRL